MTPITTQAIAALAASTGSPAVAALVGKKLDALDLPPLPEPWINDGSKGLADDSRRHYAEDQMIDYARLAVAALEAQLAAAEARTLKAVEAMQNAARYEWLRNPDNDIAFVIDKPVLHSANPFSDGEQFDYEYRSGDELDAAIDAAIIAGSAA